VTLTCFTFCSEGEYPCNQIRRQVKFPAPSMNYRALFRRKQEVSKPPTVWNFVSEMVTSMQLFFEMLISFPSYILTKLGITNIIPTLLSTQSIVGPAVVATSVTAISCSIGIGLGVGLGVGLTCAKDADLMNSTNITNSTNGITRTFAALSFRFF
jgi:hypothetical protein